MAGRTITPRSAFGSGYASTPLSMTRGAAQLHRWPIDQPAASCFDFAQHDKGALSTTRGAQHDKGALSVTRGRGA
jgi:hypothetical protein